MREALAVLVVLILLATLGILGILATRDTPLLVTPADYPLCVTVDPGPVPVKHKPILLYPERNPST